MIGRLDLCTHYLPAPYDLAEPVRWGLRSLSTFPTANDRDTLRNVRCKVPPTFDLLLHYVGAIFCLIDFARDRINSQQGIGWLHQEGG